MSLKSLLISSFIKLLPDEYRYDAVAFIERQFKENRAGGKTSLLSYAAAFAYAAGMVGSAQAERMRGFVCRVFSRPAAIERDDGRYWIDDLMFIVSFYIIISLAVAVNYSAAKICGLAWLRPFETTLAIGSALVASRLEDSVLQIRRFFPSASLLICEISLIWLMVAEIIVHVGVRRPITGFLTLISVGLFIVGFRTYLLDPSKNWTSRRDII